MCVHLYIRKTWHFGTRRPSRPLLDGRLSSDVAVVATTPGDLHIYVVRSTVSYTCSVSVVRRRTYHASTSGNYGHSPDTFLFHTGDLMDSDWYSKYTAQPDDVAWYRANGCDEAWATYKVFVRVRRYLRRAYIRIAPYAYLMFYLCALSVYVHMYKDFIRNPFCIHRLHRPSDGRTSSPTTHTSRRAFVGHSVRCPCTVIHT